MTTISDERLAEMLAEVEIEQENAVADAEADQNPQLAVDAVGEFALSEVSSILTELQSLRAQGGVRVKPLEWDNNGVPHTKAVSAVGLYTINVTSGHRYQLNRNYTTPGSFFDTIEQAKAAAQADYERRILSTLDLSPAEGESND